MEKQFKMKNNLKWGTKLRQLGHRDVTMNGGKHGKQSPCGDPPNKRIKKPTRGEVNYLPDYPDGQDDSTLEDARQLMVDEMKKKSSGMKRKTSLHTPLHHNASSVGFFLQPNIVMDVESLPQAIYISTTQNT